jgi:hypothetical protein
MLRTAWFCAVDTVPLTGKSFPHTCGKQFPAGESFPHTAADNSPWGKTSRTLAADNSRLGKASRTLRQTIPNGEKLPAHLQQTIPGRECTKPSRAKYGLKKKEEGKDSKNEKQSVCFLLSSFLSGYGDSTAYSIAPQAPGMPVIKR